MGLQKSLLKSVALIFLTNTMNNMQIPQDALISYPPDKYKYIILNFIKNDNKIIPSNNLEENSYKCYFIFKKINWYNRNEVRRKSDFFSEDTYNQEFSYFLFKKEIIEQLFEAVVDENGNFVDFQTDEEKDSINVSLIDYAVSKYIENFTHKKTFNVNIDQLSKDIHQYFRYNIKKQAGKITGFIKPHMPSAVMLKSLINQFPGMPLEELMDMDEQLLGMLQTVAEQENISSWESEHLNENVRMHNSKIGSKPQVQLKSMSDSPVTQTKKHRVPLHDATTNK